MFKKSYEIIVYYYDYFSGQTAEICKFDSLKEALYFYKESKGEDYERGDARRSTSKIHVRWIWVKDLVQPKHGYVHGYFPSWEETPGFPRFDSFHRLDGEEIKILEEEEIFDDEDFEF